MITDTIPFAPAGVLGRASIDVRPYACAGVRPTAAPIVAPMAVAPTPLGGLAAVQGSDVLLAGPARRLRDLTTGAVPTGTVVAGGRKSPLLPESDPQRTNDGTTPLGIHSPGRPTS
jgi:hypothetical protein